MNKETDKRLDDLFKKKLEDPVDPVGYNEANWATLETMLDGGKKRGGIIYWLPILSGVAALLLLFLGWWAFRPTENNAGPKNNAQLQAAHHPTANSGTNGGSIRQNNDTTTKKLTPESFAKAATASKASGRQNSFLPLSAYGSRPTTGPIDTVKNKNAINRSTEILAAESPVMAFENIKVPAPDLEVRNSKNIVGVDHRSIANSTMTVSTIKPKVIVKQGFRPQFALSAIAAPDVNGVGSFQQSKVGTNVGLLFSAGISKKLSISTGAVYSVKPYITNFANYHTLYQFPVNPVNVTADCRMLDIPINIGYQVYSRHQNKITLGTGLSSYIMLHESYKFNYTDAGGSYPVVTGPAGYTVPNSSKYFFGVVNLNATYEHQVNSKFGLTVQPYVKLPITNIGYSQVRLQTTGVAFGVTWNINSLMKH